MHVPKTGGLSIHEALERALPPAWLSPKRWDSSFFAAGFEAFDQLTGDARQRVVADGDLDCLAEARVISGHFCLENLERVAPAGAVATVLREPRARLLSLYTYWRLTPGLREWFHPYVVMSDLARRPLDDFLAEPQIAGATDNQVCRMLLHGDPRLPSGAFIADDDMAAIARDAVDRLATLGFVGVLEQGEALWDGLSRFFGFPLQAGHSANVTSATGTLSAAVPGQMKITPRTLRLLELRTAADAIVYDWAAHPSVERPNRRWLREAAFATQLVRFGDLIGHTAAMTTKQAVLLEELQSENRELCSRHGHHSPGDCNG